MASITIQGVDKLVAKLGKAAAYDTLRAPMERAVLRIHRDMATYPPKPSWSKYIRTGTLGRRWTTKVTRTGDGLQGRVGNVTEYAPPVQAKQYQRPIFRRIGWPTDEDTVSKNLGAIVRDFEDTIKKVLD